MTSTPTRTGSESMGKEEGCRRRPRSTTTVRVHSVPSRSYLNPKHGKSRPVRFPLGAGSLPAPEHGVRARSGIPQEIAPDVARSRGGIGKAASGGRFGTAQVPRPRIRPRPTPVSSGGPTGRELNPMPGWRRSRSGCRGTGTGPGAKFSRRSGLRTAARWSCRRRSRGGSGRR